MAQGRETAQVSLPPEVEDRVVEALAQGIAAAIWKEGLGRGPTRRGRGLPALRRLDAGSANTPTGGQDDEG